MAKFIAIIVGMIMLASATFNAVQGHSSIPTMGILGVGVIGFAINCIWKGAPISIIASIVIGAFLAMQ